MTSPGSLTSAPPRSRALGEAPLLEVFASLQGEGRFVGEPQVFVRLWGCPLRCAWCDTPGSWSVPMSPTARVAARGGTRRESGWATAERVAQWIEEVDPGGRRALSVTGGEPLLWPLFVRELRARMPHRRLHLETAGAHPAALSEVRAHVDHVSLDLKLPSDLAEPVPLGPERESVPRDARAWAVVRAEVLALVRGQDACAKVIVAGGRAVEDFEPLLDDVARLAPELPVYLQPVTPHNGVAAPRAGLLFECVERALARGLAVRVVPQIHPVLGVP